MRTECLAYPSTFKYLLRILNHYSYPQNLTVSTMSFLGLDASAAVLISRSVQSRLMEWHTLLTLASQRKLQAWTKAN